MTQRTHGGQVGPGQETKVETVDARRQAACTWAAGVLGRDDLEFSVASADASFRRYFRVRAPDASWIIMDAPPAQEDTRPFIDIAERLRLAGVNAPAVLAADASEGFLLLSDLGTQTFLEVMTPANADEYFDAAVSALVRMQQKVDAEGLPPYDTALLARELNLYPDWYLRCHKRVTFNDDEQRIWGEASAALVDSALTQPHVFVHRDYMPRNLMVSDPLPGVIDFQDAVFGPVTYDLVSLFRDAFVSWPESLIARHVADYCSRAQAAGVALPDDFERAFDWMGLQRHLKVIGIFARLNYRDGKAKYLAETPRFFNYVYEIGGKYREFDALLDLMRRYE